MFICCSDLYGLKHFKEIKLVAGERGLNRRVSWPFICTTPTISEWVYGGELLFITGAGIETDEVHLLELMNEAISKHIAGFVILMGGEYLKAIPDSLLNLANQEAFPLFIMPWNLKLLDVTQEISQFIIAKTERTNKHKEFIEQLLLSSSPNTDLEELLLHSGIAPRHFSFIATIRINDCSGKYLEDIKSDISRLLMRCSYGKSCQLLCVEYINLVTCLALADTKDEVERLDAYLIRIINEINQNYLRIKVNIAIGRICQGLKGIYFSHLDAKRVLDLNSRGLVPDSTTHYSSLGIYRLFLDLDCNDPLVEFCNNSIGPLIKRDKEGNSQLVETLRCYMLNNCNLIKTAQALYIHRNTLIYRLKLIQDIIGKDLNDCMDRQELFFSIIAAEFLDLINLHNN